MFVLYKCNEKENCLLSEKMTDFLRKVCIEVIIIPILCYAFAYIKHHSHRDNNSS